MSAFFLYSQAYRQRTKEEHPSASFGDLVSKEMDLFECFLRIIYVFSVVWNGFMFVTVVVGGVGDTGTQRVYAVDRGFGIMSAS